VWVRTGDADGEWISVVQNVVACGSFVVRLRCVVDSSMWRLAEALSQVALGFDLSFNCT
jgi:hypothetical protein